MRLFHLVQTAHSALFRAADLQSRRLSDLTLTQAAVLFVLSQRDGQPISDIAATLAMGKSSLTGLIDRLCEKGLVRRTASDRDGRSTLIYLEPLGAQAVRTLAPHVAQQNAALLAPFSKAEQEVIERFLTHLSQTAPTVIAGQSAKDETR